jgi:ribonuclease BN (tRNA processing enzyme)
VELTVIGGDGGWPAPGGACSGYLVEHEGFRLLIDPGYAVVPRLLRLLGADDVDAVFVSHGHPDHCADLNPLLRVRAFMPEPPAALPVYALPEALDAVLALDRASMLGGSYNLHHFQAGDSLSIGPFSINTRLLPHPRPNAGVRLSAGGTSFAYTGDCGPSDGLVELAASTDLLLAEASYAEEVPSDLVGSLSSARDVAVQAADAGVRSLVLTHLLPGQDRRAAARSAKEFYAGPLTLARPRLGVVVGA